MPFDVNVEQDGEAIRANVSIIPHWRQFGKTYGFECRESNGYRNDQRLETRVRLTALGSRSEKMWDLTSAEPLVPPERFPEELSCEFVYSEDIKAKIVQAILKFDVKFTERIPWGLTAKDRNLRAYCKLDQSTSIPRISLQLVLFLIFHPPKGRPAPIEFEWGSPRVLSGGFETNRRKH
jgi:hypothetical protein